MEAGAGTEAAFPDAEYIAQGRQDPARLAPRFSQAADIIVQVLCHGSNDATGKDDLPLLRRDQVLVGFLRPLGSIETIREVAEPGRHVVFRRADAADDPRAEHGRAFVDGDDRRLQGRRDRRRPAAAAFSRC